MEEKKENPPAYMVSTAEQAVTKSPNRKWFYGLLFYAGAVTATLVTVAILGSMYINTVKDGCTVQDQEIAPPLPEYENDQPQKKKHYDMPGVNEDEKEDIDLDLAADKEVIRFSGPQYGNGTALVVIDFKKGIIGLYNSKGNVCYLIGGFDAKYPNTTAMDQFLSQSDPALPRPVAEDAGSIGDTYDVMYDRPVKDLSLLPTELHASCWGKPVYWLKKHEEGGRQKRSLWLCCYYWYCGSDLCRLCWYSCSSDCTCFLGWA